MFGMLSSNNANFNAKRNEDNLCYWRVKDGFLWVLYYDTSENAVKTWQTTHITKDYVSEYGNRIVGTANSLYCPCKWINTPYEEVVENGILEKKLGLKSARAMADEVSNDPEKVLEYLYGGME